MKKYLMILFSSLFALEAGNSLTRTKQIIGKQQVIGKQQEIVSFKQLREEFRGLGNALLDEKLKGISRLLVDGIHEDDSKIYICDFDTIVKKCHYLPEGLMQQLLIGLERKDGYLLLASARFRIQYEGDDLGYVEFPIFYDNSNIQAYNYSQVKEDAINKALTLCSTQETSASLKQFTQLLVGQKALFEQERQAEQVKLNRIHAQLASIEK